MTPLTKGVEEIIDQVSPNLRGAVRWLWQHGYQTTDSGDGSNHAAGMEGALPYDHIAITMQPVANFISQTEYLQMLLDQKGCPNVLVEATFFPRAKVCIILLSDTESTGQLRGLK